MCWCKFNLQATKAKNDKLKDAKKIYRWHRQRHVQGSIHKEAPGGSPPSGWTDRVVAVHSTSVASGNRRFFDRYAGFFFSALILSHDATVELMKWDEQLEKGHRRVAHVSNCSLVSRRLSRRTSERYSTECTSVFIVPDGHIGLKRAFQTFLKGITTSLLPSAIRLMRSSTAREIVWVSWNESRELHEIFRLCEVDVSCVGVFHTQLWDERRGFLKSSFGWITHDDVLNE